jgi:hypothetical protein
VGLFKIAVQPLHVPGEIDAAKRLLDFFIQHFAAAALN